MGPAGICSCKKGEITLIPRPQLAPILLLRGHKKEFANYRWKCKIQEEWQVSHPQLPGLKNPLDLHEPFPVWEGLDEGKYFFPNAKKRRVLREETGVRKKNRLGIDVHPPPAIDCFPFPVLSHSFQQDFPKSPVPGSCPRSQSTSQRYPALPAPGSPRSFWGKTAAPRAGSPRERGPWVVAEAWGQVS